MMTNRRLMLTIAVIAFFAALCGVLVGRSVFPTRPAPGADLHALLHDRLELDAAQKKQLAQIEAKFAIERRALEMELRADNARLADAIEAEHGNGPRVAAAVDASHRSMGELQKATLAHVFAMRQILRPDQTATFDQAVVRALTADVR